MDRPLTFSKVGSRAGAGFGLWCFFDRRHTGCEALKIETPREFRHRAKEWRIIEWANLQPLVVESDFWDEDPIQSGDPVITHIHASSGRPIEGSRRNGQLEGLPKLDGSLHIPGLEGHSHVVGGDGASAFDQHRP